MSIATILRDMNTRHTPALTDFPIEITGVNDQASNHCSNCPLERIYWIVALDMLTVSRRNVIIYHGTVSPGNDDRPLRLFEVCDLSNLIETRWNFEKKWIIFFEIVHFFHILGLGCHHWGAKKTALCRG